MARAAEIRRGRIFDRALTVAKKRASRDGLKGLTARRIAEEVGCSVGTLYNVFDNMDTLILHVNGRTLDALHGELTEVGAGGDGGPAASESADSLSAVRALMLGYLDFTQRDPNLWNLIFEHSWPRDYPIPAWYHDKIHRVLGLLADALAPLFPPGDEVERYRAASVLWSGLHGIFSLSAAGKLGIVTGDGVAGMSDLLTSCFVAGLRQRRAAAVRD